jgi:hypothetical protein
MLSEPETLLAPSASTSYMAQKNTQLGQVCVSITSTTLTITYPDISPGYYADLHATVQTSKITEPVQGQWEYGVGKGCSYTGGKASCSIQVLDSWKKCDVTLYIGMHAKFFIDGSENTGWADGTCIESRPNCPKYFTFNPTCECKVVTTYDPYTTSVSRRISWQHFFADTFPA